MEVIYGTIETRWIAVNRYNSMRWFKIGRETDFGEDGRPFMGIGPDGIRMTRGETMPWPYNEDGTHAIGYMSVVGVIEVNKAAQLAKEAATEAALNKWMDDLMNDRMPFPTLEEFLAEFGQKKYSARVIQEFTANIGKLLIEELKKVVEGNK